MKIKNVVLKNIRSYESENIEFPEGSVLLSGDIGSGKTTLLLAIEFALFGLQKGIIDGSALLRHGQHKGFVSLSLDLGNKKIVLKRSLIRKRETVVQGEATITADGHERELTVSELKHFVFDILRYPKQLLNKKNLIYRYTVYNPQEEMKSIIFADTETRLDTLRKIFDADKYKRILNAASVFVTSMKEKTKEKEGKIYDLQFKKERSENIKAVLNETRTLFEELRPKVNAIEHEILALKKGLETASSNIKELNRIKQDFVATSVKIEQNANSLSVYEKEAKELEQEIRMLNAKLNLRIEHGEIIREKEEKETEIQEYMKKEKELSKTIAGLETQRKHFLEQLSKISGLKTCPVCKQDVDDNHRERITQEIKDVVKKIDEDLGSNVSTLKGIDENIRELDAAIKNLTQKEKIALEANKQKEMLQEKEKTAARLSAKIKDALQTMAELKKQKETLQSALEKYKHEEQKHEELSELLEKKMQEEKKLLEEMARLDSKIKEIEKETRQLAIEIAEKEKFRTQIGELKNLQEFLANAFTSLMQGIEKQVMLKLNQEFNLLFQKWFTMLIDDENLEARIGLDFSPLIEQAGYDTVYGNLSGGEKTALALAYRLALNQVVNSLLSNIATRNLLILDEPTDGFSDEQLSKMRDVLQELRTEQLIIVSHEPKIESFVDNVLRVEKRGHASTIVKQ